MINVFIGVMGSGKDFNAKMFMKRSTAKNKMKIAFADALRDMVWTMLNWKPISESDYVDFKENYSVRLYDKRTSKYVSGLDGRKFLQLFGTEAIRRYKPNFWADVVYEKILSNMDDDTDIFITDCRFENEIQALLKFKDVRFIFCNFKSPSYYISEHESEKVARDILNSGQNFKDLDDITEYVRKTYSEKKPDIDIQKYLLEKYCDIDTLMFMDGYDDCILGVIERIGTEPYVVYDKEKVLSKIMLDGMSYEEAVEWYEYNQLGSFMGEKTVGFIDVIDYDKIYFDFAD